MRTDKTQKGTGYYKINYSFKRERLKHIKKFKAVIIVLVEDSDCNCDEMNFEAKNIQK